MGYCVLLKCDGARIRFDEPDHHVEGRRFSGAVWAQQTDDFPSSYRDGNPIDHPAVAVLFHQFVRHQQVFVHHPNSDLCFRGNVIHEGLRLGLVHGRPSLAFGRTKTFELVVGAWPSIR